MIHKFTSSHEIIRLNIEHYSKLLETALDERTRTMVGKLLAEEKAKLAKLVQQDKPADASAGRRGAAKLPGT
jgi:hypothetical protein